MGTQSITNQIISAMQTFQVERVSVASDGTEANSDSSNPSISADGRFVTYFSGASNLVPGDTNDDADIFVFDRQTGATTRVSVASDGTEANGGQHRNFRDIGRWPLRNLLQRCHEFGPRGHQRRRRHLCVRPTDRHHHARLGGQRRDGGQ